MTLHVVTYKEKIFDFQVGLSNKQAESIHALVASKGPDWGFNEFDITNIVQFIENIKNGYTEHQAEFWPKKALECASKDHDVSGKWDKEKNVDIFTCNDCKWELEHPRQ